MFLKFLLEPDLHLKEPFSRTSDKLLSFLCCVQFYQNNDSIEIVLHSISLVCYHLLICFEKKQKIVFFVISQQKKIKKIIFSYYFVCRSRKFCIVGQIEKVSSVVSSTTALPRGSTSKPLIMKGI